MRRVIDDQRLVPEQLAAVVQRDDRLVAEPGQGLALLAQAGVVAGIRGEVEHALLASLRVRLLDDECDRTGAAAETPLDLDAAGAGVPGAGTGRVVAPLAVWASQLILDQVQILDEFRGGANAGAVAQLAIFALRLPSGSGLT